MKHRGKGGRGEGILGGGNNMNKTMETGQLRLYLTVIKVIHTSGPTNGPIAGPVTWPTNLNLSHPTLTGNASLSGNLTPVTILQPSFSWLTLGNRPRWPSQEVPHLLVNPALFLCCLLSTSINLLLPIIPQERAPLLVSPCTPPIHGLGGHRIHY